MKDIRIVDCTLRDGLQAAGYSLDYNKREKILNMLIAAGIKEIEAGIPCSSPDERRWLEEMHHKTKEKDVSLICWCRAKKEDLTHAAQTKIGRVHMAFPVSSVLMDLYNKDPRTLVNEASCLIREAKEKFPFVSIGLMDSLRSERPFLKEMYQIADKAGADQIRISDTVGTAMPWEIEDLLRFLTRGKGPDIEFHGHNDLGLATANSLAAIRGGAKAVSCTLSGIGERAGNCRLEELLSCLIQTGEYKNLPDLRSILRAEEWFRKISQFNPSLARPLTGKRIFTHESGVHGQGLQARPNSYCGLNPADFGRGHEYLYGDSSGRSMVEKFLSTRGHTLEAEELESFMISIKEAARKRGRSLSGEELEEEFLARCS
jgi:homocitrate synthase NifV